MDAEFWHERWRENRIGFHEESANALLVAHFDAMRLGRDSRVFLPLCGKTRDIKWLMTQGYRVAGAELSARAIEQLFEGLDVEPKITDLGPLTQYHADGIDIFVGDVFDLTASALGPIDAVYDRAALVALPHEARERYAARMTEITAGAPQFLICFEYDQHEMEGPPFAVLEAEMSQSYGDAYGLKRIAQHNVAGGLKGKCAATENVWLLRRP